MSTAYLTAADREADVTRGRQAGERRRHGPFARRGSHAARAPRPDCARRVWWLLWIWTAVWAAAHTAQFSYSWHYFAEGVRLLFAGGPGGGLELYASHPQLQIGPVTLMLAAPIAALGLHLGRFAAMVVMTAAGPVLLGAIWRLVPPRARMPPNRLLVAGLIFLPVWTELGTHYGHLDDVAALAFGVAAMHAIARRRPVLAALLLAAATDAKPWAAGFAAMLLALPRPTWRRSLPAFAGAVAIAWLPFLAADPHSLTAAKFAIPNSSASALRALGVTSARTPSWDRLAQFTLGGLLAAAAVLRRRWTAVILLTTAARILLDPSVYPYYTSGVLVGAVAYDLVTAQHRYPRATIAGALCLYVAHFGGSLHVLSPHVLGVLRAAYVIGVMGAVVAWRQPDPLRRLSHLRPARAGPGREPGRARGRVPAGAVSGGARLPDGGAPPDWTAGTDGGAPRYWTAGAGDNGFPGHTVQARGAPVPGPDRAVPAPYSRRAPDGGWYAHHDDGSRGPADRFWHHGNRPWHHRDGSWEHPGGSWYQRDGSWHHRDDSWRHGDRSWHGRDGSRDHADDWWHHRDDPWRHGNRPWHGRDGSRDHADDWWYHRDDPWRHGNRPWHGQDGHWEHGDGYWRHADASWNQDDGSMG